MKKARLVAPMLVGALLMTGTSGCASSAGPDQTASPPSAAAVAVASPPPTCSFKDEGVCIGPLKANASYTSSAFAPAISYSVPDAGWSNDEDLPGNFLLVPPGNTEKGVDAGTSDFIGVYSDIAPEQFAALPSCAVVPVDGVPATPAAFATWLHGLGNVTSTTPVVVSVGGLHGVRVDIRLKSQSALPHCTDDTSGAAVRYLPIFAGLNESSVDHGLGPLGLTMRLYLLAYNHRVLALEVDDIPNAPGTLSSLSAVAEKMRFAVG